MPGLPVVAVLPTVSDFVYGIGIAATVVFAVSGVMEAGRRGMDLVGVTVLALVTAVGGGTVRDLLLDRPIFWISDASYLLAPMATALIAFILLHRHALPERLFLVPDAIGLALFTVAGTQIALDFQTPWLAASLLGVITGAFGGVLRDVFCNEIPLIFLPGELYASAAWAGALTLIGLQEYGVDATTAGWAAMALVFLLRLASMRMKLRLPTLPSRG
jgi:uncharacterized membrane protein YeiH